MGRHPDDAHRPLEKSHHLEASLSHVETRQGRNHYAFPWGGEWYRIERESVVSGLRGATVRVEARLDGSLAVRFHDRYLKVGKFPAPERSAKPAKTKPVRKSRTTKPGSEWKENFDLKKGPKIWQAAQESGYRK